MNILFRCDANNKIGIGHGIRCLALAEALRGNGGRICFVFNDDISAGLLDIFTLKKIRTQKITVESGGKKDAKKTREFARQFKADWVIIDGYVFDKDYQNIIKEGGLKLLCIDDMASCKFAADIILNQNPGFLKTDYRCAKGARLLLGPEYIILRQEFICSGRKAINVGPRLERIFLSMGGADKNNLTSKVLKALNLLDFDVRVAAIVGPANSCGESLKDIQSDLNYQIDFVYNPHNIMSYMIDSDLGIHACGTTSWELAYLGIPSISIIAAENQLSIARSLSDTGYSFNLGWHDRFTGKELARTVQKARSVLLRKKMSRQGRRLVDGKGVERIMEAMKSV